MAVTFTFTCSLPNGVHARPASAIEEVTRSFAAQMSLFNERTGQAANAKSVLAMVGLDIRLGDRCRLVVEGTDERGALDRLSAFFSNDFPHADDALPVIVEAPSGDVTLPPVLRHSGARVHQGTPVVPGIGVGRAVTVGGFGVPSSLPLHGVTDVFGEVALVRSALTHLEVRYEEQIARAPRGVQGDVLRAHRSVARDPEFQQSLVDAIEQRGATAAGAVAEAESRFAQMLLASASTLLRERGLDVRDVCNALLHEIYGAAARAETTVLDADSVCLADTLTPGQFLALDRRYLRGLILAHGGTTSHTIILARSFAVPCIVGVSDAAALEVAGQQVVVDGDIGVLVTGLTDDAVRYYDMERARLAGRARRLRRFQALPAETTDGRRMEVAANIGTADEAVAAFSSGAEGIGLFRTEMLFLERHAPPTEDEQFEEYRRALAAADGKPVIIRTLDVGGDKPIPYLRLPPEDNPFLGYRAVRLYPEFEQIFRSQVRALVRASPFGRLRVMVPMVSRLEEVRWVKAVIADEQAHAEQDGVSYDEEMQLGVMVEVPSLAFLIDHVAAEVDFLSIGTNDLLQYFTAVDRANRKVASLNHGFAPSFLRLLNKIVEDGHSSGKWVGLCGEMGGQAAALPLLVGLGLDEISMAAPAIARTKADIHALSACSCSALVATALGCSDAGAVDGLLNEFDRARPAPLVDAELVTVHASARTKAEAIKQAVDSLYVAGRTDRPRVVEEAVWQREAVYSTGFGHAFAIPHCKTDAVRSNSLAVLKLDTPVEWGSLDDRPVQLLILLAIRESDHATAHMKVLAALARKVMHDDFRQALVHEDDPQNIAQIIRSAVGGSADSG